MRGLLAAWAAETGPPDGAPPSLRNVQLSPHASGQELLPRVAAPRAGCWLLALACLPATAFFGYVMYLLVADGPDHGLGWYSFALGAPLLAVLLVLLPQPRRWVGARRRAAIRAA